MARSHASRLIDYFAIYAARYGKMIDARDARYRKRRVMRAARRAI